MKVKLRRTWFYPVDAKPVNDRRAISGGRLRKGTHEIDNALRPYLPSDALILDEAQGDAPVILAADTELAAFDVDRAGAELAAKAEEEAEARRQEMIKAKRLAALEKAREAKKEKQKAE